MISSCSDVDAEMRVLFDGKIKTEINISGKDALKCQWLIMESAETASALTFTIHYIINCLIFHIKTVSKHSHLGLQLRIIFIIRQLFSLLIISPVKYEKIVNYLCKIFSLHRC